MHPSRKLALAALFASILSACGGGGGGDGTAGNSAAPLASGSGGTSAGGAPVGSGGGSSTDTPGSGSAPPSPAPAPTPAAFSAFDPVLLASNPLPLGAAVARLADGGNVAVWVAAGATTRDSRLMAQRTDAAGHAVGGAITVHEEVERVSQVAVAPATDGGFLVAWSGFDAVAVTPGAVNKNLLARRYAADGTFQSETRLHPASLYDVSGISLEPVPGGGFVVGWSTKILRTAPYWGFVQRLGAGGELVGAQVQLVADGGGAEQEQIALVPSTDGTVTAAWRQRSALSPMTYSIFTRQFDASMQALSPPTELAGTTQGTPFLLSAAAAGTHIALAWTVPAGGASDIRSTVIAPRAASAGTIASVTSTFQVSDLRVEPLGASGFGVIWQEIEGYPRGINAYVHLQRHDAAGAATGAPTVLDARGTSWVSDITGAGVTAGTVLAVDAGSDGHVVGEVQIAGRNEPGAYLFGR